MNYTFAVTLAILLKVGFVPNKKNPRYHIASCTIGDYTVWCKNFVAAQQLANRVMRALAKQGLHPRYRVEDSFDSYQYNW